MNRKIELRKIYKEKRRSIAIENFNNGNKAICASLCQSSWYGEARIIMAYLAIGQEVSLDEFIVKALNDGKQICVPYCTNQKGIMKAIKLTSLDQVKKGLLGIRIPNDITREVSVDDIDVILVPGVAFDKKGGRLGMGAGYYDRFLGHTSNCIGIAWDLQISSEDIPMQKHDIKMKQIVTESRVIICQNQNK